MKRISIPLTLLVVGVFAAPLLAQSGGSDLEFRKRKSELRGKIKSADAMVRADACVVLAQFKSQQATKLLIEGLENSDKATQLLYEDRVALYKDWEKKRVDPRQVASKEEMARYRAAQAKFAQHYESFMRDRSARYKIIEAMKEIDDPVSIDLLCTKLRTNKKNWVLRCVIAEALGDVESPLALDALLTAADKSSSKLNYDVRVAVRAVYSLARRTEQAALEGLLKAGREADEWQVRSAVINAIAQHDIKLGQGLLEEMAEKESGRLRQAALEALAALDRRRRREVMDRKLEFTLPCLTLECASRNIVFLVSSGTTMSWPLDDSDEPSIPPELNRPRFDWARDGVKDYLRWVLAEYDELRENDELDEKKDFKPFRFNICMYNNGAEFFVPGGMCEIEEMKDIGKIEEAISWLDWENPNLERAAVGDANLVEAIDKAFHLAGFGARYSEANYEIQPDTILCLFDRTPTGGAFSWRGDDEEGEDGEREAWNQIHGFVAATGYRREVRVDVVNLGVTSRFTRGYARTMAKITGGIGTYFRPEP